MLTGQVAIVTGGSQGIGRAIVECLAQQGAVVWIGDLYRPADLETLSARYDGRVYWHNLDVSDSASVQTGIAAMAAKGLDILVNNAGIMFEKSLDQQSEDDWQRMLAINLTGPFLMCKYALPYLQLRGGARIVNVGSLEGIAANPDHTAYAATKGGVHGLTIALAVELGRHGIRCNAVAPGWIDTDLNRVYMESHPDRDLVMSQLGRLHPLGAIGQPSDVGDVVTWLVSDRSQFVNGQVIIIDGARMSRPSLPDAFNR